MKLKIFVRDACPADRHNILDIDLKSFEFPWTQRKWAVMEGQNQIRVATRGYEGDVAGFIVYDISGNSVRVKKMATKPAYRRLGVSEALLERVAKDVSGSKVIHLIMVVPEHTLCPTSHDNIVGWVQSVGFKAGPPYTKDAFTYCGSKEPGITLRVPLGSFSV